MTNDFLRMTTHELLTRCIEHLKYFFKTVVIEVGVRNAVIFTRMYVIEDEADFSAMFLRSSQAQYVAQVFGIHDEDVVKFIKIRCLKLSGALIRDIHPMQPRSGDGAVVGWAADMPGTGAGTVHCPVQTALSDFMFQNAFGQRTAADVAEANHEDTHIKVV